jgi:hypothetical protein
MAKATASFQFKDPEVAKKYQPVDCPADFKIRVPQANWPANGDHGWFSEITPEVADQLIKEKYNRLSPVE